MISIRYNCTRLNIPDLEHDDALFRNFRCAFQMDKHLCIYGLKIVTAACGCQTSQALLSYSPDQRVPNTDGEVDGRLRLHHHDFLFWTTCAFAVFTCLLH